MSRNDEQPPVRDVWAACAACRVDGVVALYFRIYALVSRCCCGSAPCTALNGPPSTIPRTGRALHLTRDRQQRITESGGPHPPSQPHHKLTYLCKFESHCPDGGKEEWPTCMNTTMCSMSARLPAWVDPAIVRRRGNAMVPPRRKRRVGK